jgi:hypothetical protein
MLAEHVQSYLLTFSFILKPTDNTTFLKQPLGCTRNNKYTRKSGVHPPALAGCGKIIPAQQHFDGLHVWQKPGLSGYLVCLVHLVSLIQPNKPDRPNRPNEQDRLADFFSILLATRLVDLPSQKQCTGMI